MRVSSFLEPTMTTLFEPTILNTDPQVRRFDDVRQLLPDVNQPTPIVRLGRVAPARELYLKLEWLNPFGSIKDRAAAYMLSELLPEIGARRLIEASSGNTALALAALAALEGIALTVTIPEGAPIEKRVLLRMLGAEVLETSDDLCPVDLPGDGAIALARAIAHSRGGEAYAWTNQYSNVANVQAHYETTGPEVWRQTQGQVRTFVAGFGTCGTISGVGRFLKEQDPSIKIVAVEPNPGHRLPGLKSFAEATPPEILDQTVVDEVVRIDDESAYSTTLSLFRQEGLMVGPSTGAIVAAALALDDPGLTVAISPDSGFKYASYFSQYLDTQQQRKEEDARHSHS
jgi:cysteine synthase A/cysteine synthase B